MNTVYDNEIRSLTNRLIEAWRTADVSAIADLILDDVVVDFDIFEENLGKAGLLEKLAQRPRKTEYAFFEQLNNIAVMGKEKARQSVSVIGTFADPNDGVWTRFDFSGVFALEFVKTAGAWKFSSIKFMLTDETMIVWPRLTSAGIGQIEGKGDPSFVSNWVSPKHDDTIGWFPGKRLPALNPVYDSPWYGMEDRIRPEHEEDLIQEAFFRYAFGIDYNNFQLWEDAFTDDCQCIYGDTQPYSKRGVIEFLKPEKQGSPRCTHIGFFTDVDIDGDTAVGKVYLRGAQFIPGMEVSLEELRKRYTWARYSLHFKKENGIWKIHRLNFYSGMAAKSFE